MTALRTRGSHLAVILECSGNDLGKQSGTQILQAISEKIDCLFDLKIILELNKTGAVVEWLKKLEGNLSGVKRLDCVIPLQKLEEHCILPLIDQRWETGRSSESKKH